jgi:superfamily II RNA helicase
MNPGDPRADAAPRAQSAPQAQGARRALGDRIPERGACGGEAVLDRFLAWVSDTGLTPYPQQEEALLELMLGHHVVLGTPTGSGKSLVALGLHFKALCEGERSFYTAPVKALVSEKFFSLCDELGPDRVGMATGDASINPDAPVLCCTTEVLANMALRRGAELDAPYVVLDEFHFYGDRERGVSWQVPLLALPDSLFLMMSATLGNTAPIEEQLERRSGRPVAHVHSLERPVPLEFEYRETPLHETLADLLETDRAPVYVVHFTQRECVEQAQALTSADVAGRERRLRIAEELAGLRFDTPFGRDVQRFLRHGVGIHHAGLLPRYRLLVERLAARGLLQVICGTDTLGVGVNIPIRSVVFSKLCKFDGEKVAILSIREFKQIAGRAGRKGFDDLGTVVCQAPEHVIENRKLAERAAADPKRRRVARKRPPSRGFVAWNRDTFQRLVERPPEPLESRFDVDHGMLLAVMQRPGLDAARAGGYRALLELIACCHERDAVKARLRRRTAQLFRSLRSAGILDVVRGERGPEVRVAPDLQEDFSLYQTLSLYLVEALSALDPESPRYALEVITLAEAILEDPTPILQAQRDAARRELLARLKAEGVPYEDRIRQLEEVTHPQPDADFVRESFRLFAASHPWVREEDVRPKCVAREMFEDCRSFADTVRRYGIGRSEGLLLRYLCQVHDTLVRSVPIGARTEALYDVVAFLRATVQRVDRSLVEAWEELQEPRAAAAAPARAFDLALHERLLTAQVRAELHALMRALAAGDYEDAARCVRADPDDPWDAARFERELAPFLEEYGRPLFTPEARQARHTLLKRTGPRSWDAFQVLLDPAGDGLWAIEAEVDLRREREPEGPLLRMRRIGP